MREFKLKPEDLSKDYPINPTNFIERNKVITSDGE